MEAEGLSYKAKFNVAILSSDWQTKQQSIKQHIRKLNPPSSVFATREGRTDADRYQSVARMRGTCIQQKGRWE